ncbi:Macrolide export ATP-binding/permease protein MacB [Planctomycetes bacterium Pan216]|uniref:Macrolide export ATP-binding/permease protein MacB n=1 Tax=Kolteria novifilia TaxID=2527975 RepID=A0A518B4D8_9BACT|nr:Macrolide export ATP-binding/permease protein MacB [Planctomycetes bacterium Pan216]
MMHDAIAPPPESDEATVIEARGVEHFFGEGETRTQVLFDNCVSIGRGEIVIMTGPSGSGKTTLLTLIGALRQIQSGSLQVLGQELLGMSDTNQMKLRKNIGFIFQQHNLFSSLSALENVRMAIELKPSSPKEMDQRGIEMLERLGMGERVHYHPENLSGGQRQRVAIARALVNRPRLILADEPTAALDAKSGETVMELFRELAEGPTGSTILIVTHDKRLIDRASRIINMVRGRIISNVATEESVHICQTLAHCKPFDHLGESALAQIADRMLCENFEQGSRIIKQGDEGDRFYVIDEGTVDVRVDDELKTELQKGSYFGEISLMESRPRTATIVAKTPVKLYSLSKSDFELALCEHGSLEERIRRVYMERQ